MTSITRRSLTFGLGASAVLGAAPIRAVARPPAPRATLPSVARRKVGAITVTALSDGYIEVPFGVFSGHTPGHTGYRIADGGESLRLVADTLFDPALHPGRTDIGIAFEADPAAAAMRVRFFPLAAEERALLAATHMPFPGLGRIGRAGGRLSWVPADWEHDS